MAYMPAQKEMGLKLQEALGLPPGYRVYSPYPFGGMNAAAGRNSMPDNQFFLIENFIKISDGKLRTVWGEGESVYTAPSGKTIINFFHYNIGSTQYAVVFLDDGTAYQVALSTGAVTTISGSVGEFYNPNNPLTACAQWGSQYLILANNITANSYWVWDGRALFTSGGIGPQVTITNAGSGYTSAPTVTAYGGSGSGATFSATVTNGAVTSVQVISPGTGYQPGENPQLRFSGGGGEDGAQLTAVLTGGAVTSIIITDGGASYTSPVVSITGGGGSGATATATQVGGVVTSITITAGGSGYTSTPTVSITDGGGGTGATAVAVLSPGTVTSVTVAQGGAGYDSTPTLTITGGGGTGATAVATIAGGAITSVSVTNGGSGYTSTPSVVITPGSNNSAAATVTLMPYGVSGAAIETYQNRVWLPFPFQSGSQNNRSKFLVSAPSSISDYATTSGGLVYTSNDSFLKVGFTNFKQSNGFLYPIADSSVSNISNVQTSGSPIVTTFNFLNTDPQIGTGWRDTCQYYSRSILLANPLGAYGLYGGSVTKISNDIDDLFIEGIFPPDAGALTPTGAVANIFNSKVYMILMTIKDPETGQPRNVLVGWDEEQWYIFSQNKALTYIGTQEVDSNLTAWATDGRDLFPMFQTPSDTLRKAIFTKLYGSETAYFVKQAMGFYVQAQDKTSDGAGVVLENMKAVTNSGSFDMMSTQMDIRATPPLYTFRMAGTEDAVGVNLGFSFTSTSPDFILTWLGLGYIMTGSVFGDSTAIEAETQIGE